MSSGSRPTTWSAFASPGLVHDIGKTGVSDRLISKAGPLEADEWHSIRTHPEIGARLLAHPEFEDLREWVLAHHERPDGKGYPYGLAGADIPLEARILAIADAYEAMTSERSFRSALGEEVAISELQSGCRDPVRRRRRRGLPTPDRRRGRARPAAGFLAKPPALAAPWGVLRKRSPLTGLLAALRVGGCSSRC